MNLSFTQRRYVCTRIWLARVAPALAQVMQVRAAPVHSERAGNGLTASRSSPASATSNCQVSVPPRTMRRPKCALFNLCSSEKTGYLPEQVFYIDETSLFWKRCQCEHLPQRKDGEGSHHMDGGQLAEEHALKWTSHLRKGDMFVRVSGW